MSGTTEKTPFKGKGKPSPVDVHVGGRIRQCRTLRGISQEKLGDAIGLTFQQVQKYERGMNRVGASRLYDLSRVLEVPVGYFFDGMSKQLEQRDPAVPSNFSEEGSDIDLQEPDPMAKRETLELVRNYYKISDPQLRRRLFEMIKALGSVAEAAVE